MKLFNLINGIKSNNKNKKHIRPLTMYTENLIEKILSNSSSQLKFKSVNGSRLMNINYDSIATETCARKFYILSSLSSKMPTDLFSIIRRIEIDCSKLIVNINLHLEPHFINWNDKSLKIRQANIESEAEEIDGTKEGYLPSDKYSQLKVAKEWTLSSYRYLKEAYQTQHSTELFSMIIEVCTVDLSEEAIVQFQDCDDRLLSVVESFGFGISKVRGNIWNFLKWWSPIGNRKGIGLSNIDKFPLVDVNIAEFTSVIAGTPDGSDVVLGYDIDSGRTVAKDFVSKSGSAENILVTAMTGEGKSMLMKSIVLAGLISDYTFVIMDRDSEYINLANEVDSKIISLNSGIYFDSMEIPLPTGDPLLDSELFQQSYTTTRCIFDIIVDKNNGMTNEQTLIFSKAHSQLCERFNVDRSNPDTWVNSSNNEFDYFALYKEIKTVISNNTDNPLWSASSAKYLLASLERYFDKSYSESDIFKTKVSIQDIYDCLDKGVSVIDIDLCIKDADGSNPSIEDCLKMTMGSYLSDSIVSYNKRKGRFTHKIWEEFQRYLYNTLMRKRVMDDITGGRKKNCITWTITNDITQFFNACNSLDEKSLQTVFANFTSFIIGYVEETQAKKICDNILQLRYCYKELKSISQRRHQFRFLAKLDDEFWCIKALVPSEFIDSPIFKTRSTTRERRSI